MTRLASRFGAANSIRRDRPLNIEELFRTVPSVFSEETDTLTSQLLPYSIVFKRKASTRSLLVRHVFVIRVVESIPSIC